MTPRRDPRDAAARRAHAEEEEAGKDSHLTLTPSQARAISARIRAAAPPKPVAPAAPAADPAPKLDLAPSWLSPIYSTVAALTRDPFWSQVIGSATGPEAVYAYALLSGLPHEEAAALALADTARYLDPASLAVIASSLAEDARPILRRAAIAGGASGFYLITQARSLADDRAQDPSLRLDALKFLASLTGARAPRALPQDHQAPSPSPSIHSERTLILQTDAATVRALVSASIKENLTGQGDGGQGQGGGIQIPYLPNAEVIDDDAD